MLEQYRQLARQCPKVRAIGEIGLDYHYEDIPREVQQRAFRAQMALARELELPVIVHEREAHEDGMRIVEEFPQVTGVFHCYSGSLEMAKVLIRRGWYIGFGGVPFRGRRNDPRRLHLVAERLAQLRGLSAEEIENITLENGKRLYRIG